MSMDVPAWPSAVGPKIPELPNKSESSDLDRALACLRRELAEMQSQDRKLHKQLLTMYSSIRELRDELQSEKEGWEMEREQDSRDCADTEAAPGYVTDVEVVENDNDNHGPRINHIKQDSGILTDDEISDEELERSIKQMLKTFPPAVRPRSSSFTATAKRSNSYHVPVAKYVESKERKNNDGKPATIARVRAISVAASDSEKLVSTRTRTQTFTEGAIPRFASMPVINEIPGDDFERNRCRSKTFALYGRRRSESVDGAVPLVSKRLPVFSPLTRHGSMPVMHSGGRSKSAAAFRELKDINNNHPTLRRATSQIVLSRTDLEKSKDTESIRGQPYRIYRSSSQISLV